MANKPTYELDDWVGAVRSDPRNTDRLTMLQGYLGTSSETGHVRVYTDESLNDFVEVPDDAIVHAVKMTPAESSLGGSKLWLRTDAVVTYGDPKAANRPITTFLEGDLMQQYGAAQPNAGQMAGIMDGQPDTTAQGQQFAVTMPVFCGPPARTLLCPATQPPVCFVPRTRFGISQCQIQTCAPIFCGGGTTRLFFCPPTCFGATRFTPSLGCPSFAGCPSIACTTTIVGNPGGTIVQQSGLAGFAGQPDTSQMGGYYGAFNPYMF